MRALYVAAVAAAFAILAGLWIYAQPRSATPMLSPQDHLEIQQLYGYYTRDVDPNSVRDASWLFTPDGTFEVRGRKYTGAKELQTFYEDLRKRQAFGIRHLNSNFLLEPTPEGARGTAYMIQVERRDAAKPIAVTVFGVYHDTFLKTAQGWRFKSREFRLDGPEAPLP